MKFQIPRSLIAITLAGGALAAPGFAQQSPEPAGLESSERPAADSDITHAGKRHTSGNGGRPSSVISGPDLALYHGEVQVLDLADVVRIAVGNGEVLRANVVASSQVVLIGEAAGSTSLRVWTRNGTQFTYEVKVRSFDIGQILRDVQDLLAGEPEISARQLDGHVLIEGDYSVAKTATRIAALLKIYPQIISTVPLRKQAPAVPVDRMVYMDVRVVEILKSTMRQLGVRWAQTAAGPTIGVNLAAAHNVPRLPNGGYFGIASNLTSMLDLTEASGESWTLAEPTVSCKSGGSAKFTVGGEVPVPVAQGLGNTTVVYKEYGIILEFKPIADDKGNVSSTIVAEVSQPDTSLSNVGNKGLIAFLKTRTETEVSLRENETLVISGLLKNTGDKAASGIPGAKDIPVLGNLFKSKNFKNDRTELVVMVTPRSIEVARDANAASIREADQMQAHVQPFINVINSKLAE